MLRNVIAAAFLLLLAACNTVKPQLNAYDGLLPTGYQLKQSTKQLDVPSLKGKTLALVTSTNFNNYLKEWQSHFETTSNNNGRSQVIMATALLSAINPVGTAGYIGAASTGLEAGARGKPGQRQVSDPRNVVDRAITAAQPYFMEIKPAADFAEAREMKADYILLVDYYASFNQMGDMFMTRGGLYLLDDSFRQVLNAEGMADVDRDDGSNGWLPPSPQGVVEGTIRTYAKALDVTTSQMISGFREKIGQSPRLPN